MFDIEEGVFDERLPRAELSTWTSAMGYAIARELIPPNAVRTYRLLQERLTQEDLDAAISHRAVDIEPEFMGFFSNYEDARSRSGDISDKVIVDFGCAYGFQSYLFENAKAYIGVDHVQSHIVGPDNAAWMPGTGIEDAIDMILSEHDPNDCIAIMSGVPDSQGNLTRLVEDAFPNAYIAYPGDTLRTQGLCVTTLPDLDISIDDPSAEMEGPTL